MEVLNSETIFINDHIEIVVDKTINNGFQNSYTYLKRKNSVCVIAINQSNEVLLVEQYRHPVRSRFIELPAGGVQSNESHETAALRELLEETGYQAESLEYFMDFPIFPSLSNEILFVYIARELKFTKQLLEKSEIDLVVHKIPIYQLSEMFTVKSRFATQDQFILMMFLKHFNYE